MGFFEISKVRLLDMTLLTTHNRILKSMDESSGTGI